MSSNDLCASDSLALWHLHARHLHSPCPIVLSQVDNSKNRVEAWRARPESAVVRRIGTSPAGKPNVENDDSLSQHEPNSLAFRVCVRHPAALTVIQGVYSEYQRKRAAWLWHLIGGRLGPLEMENFMFTKYFAKRYRLVCGKEATGFAGRPGQGEVLPRRSSWITCSGSLEEPRHVHT
jgi:hypothetical protein